MEVDDFDEEAQILKEIKVVVGVGSYGEEEFKSSNKIDVRE